MSLAATESATVKKVERPSELLAVGDVGRGQVDDPFQRPDNLDRPHEGAIGHKFVGGNEPS
jgi:hypothetical protein